MRNLRLILTKKKYLWMGFVLFLFSLGVSARHQFYHLLGQTYPALSITPTSASIGTGIAWKFSAVGGVPPYTYSLIGSGGSIDPVTGIYTSDTLGGTTVTVRVKDGALQTADATVTVAAPPVVTCGTALWYTNSLNGRLYDPGGPSSDYPNNAYCEFEIDVGRFPISIHFNSFSTNSANDDLHVEDWNYNPQNYSGLTVPADRSSNDGYFYMEFESDASGTAPGFDLTWSATNPAQPQLNSYYDGNLEASYSRQYVASGGVGPYTFSIVSGGGSIAVVDSKTIIYTAPLNAGTPVLRVTDALNQTFDVQVTVTKAALSITSTGLNGLPAGGYIVGVSGSGFLKGVTVTIGGVNCPVTYNTYSGYFECTVPAGSPGVVDLVVTNPDGASVTVTGGFEYLSGTWSTMPSPSTSARAYNANIWTGDRLIIWGGADPSCTYATCTKTDGFVYNPLTDSWSAMAASPLAGRVDMAQIWTGHEAIMFGGRINNSAYSDGAKYNPYTNTWTAIAAPTWSARQLFSQAWTGKEMIIYGGQWSGSALNSGIAYNPSSNTWRTIAAGTSRWRHQAVWTGQKMFVFGGATDSAYTVFSSTGALYDPESNTWTAASASGLRAKATSNWFNNFANNFLLWTGDKVFVSGGGDKSASGRYDGFYDPKTDTWTNPTSDMPGSTYPSSMVWTGDRVVRTMIYPTGGSCTVTSLNVATQAITNLDIPLVQAQGRSLVWTGEDIITCFGYNGASTGGDCERLNIGSNLKNRLAAMGRDTWLSMTSTGAPSARSGATSIWNGKYYIVWGGTDGSSYLNTGYKYDPFADAWTAISTTGAPSGRIKHTAIWSGTKMLIWGGQTAAGVQTNTGAIYDPATDTWTATSVAGSVPTAREDHTAVWSGSKMIVWGGRGSSGVIGDGAILDLPTNTWSTLATTGSPPTARARHQALWTGDKMIIWGGDDGATFTNTGSYYDFNASTWTALSTTSAPSARADFVMILAKDKFVVWGGVDSSANAIGDGGIYDLAGGTWTATATTGAPSARSQSSSVYADQSMVIWGGKNGATSYNDGFRLNTQTNSWTALSSSGLSARYGAQMVWTGTVGDGRANGSKSYRNNLNGVTSRLMIWGGYDGASYQNDGKIHNLPFQ